MLRGEKGVSRFVPARDLIPCDAQNNPFFFGRERHAPDARSSSAPAHGEHSKLFFLFFLLASDMTSAKLTSHSNQTIEGRADDSQLVLESGGIFSPMGETR